MQIRSHMFSWARGSVVTKPSKLSGYASEVVSGQAVSCSQNCIYRLHIPFIAGLKWLRPHDSWVMYIYM